MSKIGRRLATATVSLCVITIALHFDTAIGAPAKLVGHGNKPVHINQSVFDPENHIELAEAGDGNSQLILGHYYRGRKNYVEALKWFQKGADMGFAPAVIELGRTYENGWGVEQDLARALKLYQEAAAGVDVKAKVEAKCAIGNMHYRGRGVPQNDVEAAKFWQIKNYGEIKQKAESGDIISQMSLAEMYLQSPCRFPQLVDEAIRWYGRAAKAGDKRAQQQLDKLVEQRDASLKYQVK